MKKYPIIILCLLILSACNLCKEGKTQLPIGAYLGEKPPSETPVLFAPNFISTGFDELFGSFTPDGKEFYYIQAGAPQWCIMVAKQNQDGSWNKPEVAEFSGQFTEKFALSPDGNKVVLTSFRHSLGYGNRRTPSVWIIERTDNGWTEPKYIEGLDSAFAPSIARNGNLYYFKTGEEHQDIYMSEFKDGKYLAPINLGDSINSAQDEADPFIAPDESYIIFNTNRDEGTGIYISYKKKDGNWSKAKNIGSPINDFAPCNVGSITPDGKYMFMFSNKYLFEDVEKRKITAKEKFNYLNSPGNGSIDTYWVKADFIQNLKPENL